jgi:hypothetical protein
MAALSGVQLRVKTRRAIGRSGASASEVKSGYRCGIGPIGLQTKLQTNRAAQRRIGRHKLGSSEQKRRTGAHA